MISCMRHVVHPEVRRCLSDPWTNKDEWKFVGRPQDAGRTRMVLRLSKSKFHVYF